MARENLCTSSGVAHLLVVIDERILLQEYGPNRWSAACVPQICGRDQASRLPNMSLLGEMFFDGAALRETQILQELVPALCRHFSVYIFHCVNPDDTSKALEAVERHATLTGTRLGARRRLFEVNELLQLDENENWLEVGCGNQCSRDTLRQACIDTLARLPGAACSPSAQSPIYEQADAND